MDDRKSLKFIYLSSFMISVNFSDQLVTDMSEPVLILVIFLHNVEEIFN